MNRRRDFLKTSAAVAATPILGAAPAARPNVLIVMTDDQGYGDFSCHGNPVLKTPEMDKIHAASVRFTDFHSAPMCTPTRGQLLSGQDALRNGATSVTAGRAMLRRGIPTMADILKGSGYRTGIFGKWHLGDHYPYRPIDRGFERAVYHLGYGLSSAPEFDNDYFNGTCHDQGVRRKFKGYCTDFWFDEAMGWMKERGARKEPFFCYLPTNTPHGPAWVDEKYAAPYKKPGLPANFFGMIANLDENLGRLDRFLTESGLKENTLLVFMTDNGATAGFNVYNAGMRERKTQVYDGGHRVPCFVRWPAAGFRTGRDVSTPAQMQDILPTVIELCGAKAPAEAKLDGRSLAPLLKDPAGKIADRMLVVQYGQIPKKDDACVIWNHWRLVYGKELYDIKADPGQKADVASKHADVVNRMKAHYDLWWAGVEGRIKDFAPISIGAEQENPTELTSADWQDIYADNVGHISNVAGGPRGGPWTIFVEREGNYEISLTRWPPHQKLALTASRAVQQLTAGEIIAGKGLPIAGAKLAVAGHEASVKTQPKDTAAVFRMQLKGGQKTTLHGWFQDSTGADIAGAFFATVRRL